MSQPTKDVLERIPTWPEEDQEELAELAREIEARRTGVYTLTDGEQKAIEAARRSEFASDDQIVAFWRRHGVA